MFLPDGDGAREKVRVDMTLSKKHAYSLSQFKSEMKDLALTHPTWWERHSTLDEIGTLFDGCHSFDEAINDIGVLGSLAKSRKPEGSTKIADVR